MKFTKMRIAVAAALGAYLARNGLAPHALALTLEKDAHGKLPESQRALYVEKDGKFVLDADIEDTSALKVALQKERDARKTAEQAAKDLAKKFEGLDADEIRRMLEQLGGDKEAQLIKAGKIDEVVALRTEKATKAHQKALEQAEGKVKTAEARATKFSQQVLDNHVRAAATKAGMHANAVDDALFRARVMFTLNEDGEPIQLDKDGQPVIGKDSKTPFGPAEWLESMKESAPHWYPAGAAGAGATGSKTTGGAKTVKRAVFDAWNPTEKANAAKENIVVVD